MRITFYQFRYGPSGNLLWDLQDLRLGLQVTRTAGHPRPEVMKEMAQKLHHARSSVELQESPCVAPDATVVVLRAAGDAPGLAAV